MTDQAIAQSSSITVERVDTVTVVRMHHGEDNRLHPSLLDGVERVLRDLEAGTDPGALVLTGTGKFFSNGLDLDYMAAEPAAADATLARVHELLAHVLGLSVPVVAAVNGHAFAAGAMLAFACDLIVMREDRGFVCLPEASLGLPFSPGMNALITARLSAPIAHEAMVTAKRYGAPEALAARIASEVTAEAEVVPRAIARAAELAGSPRSGLGAIKRGLYATTLDALTGRTS